MKTTIDLPDDLLRRLKMRAVRDGRKLKDVAADMLRQGLSRPSPPKTLPQPRILKDKKTGLPVLEAPDPSVPVRPLTPDQIDQILLDQEVEWWGGMGGVRDST